MRIFIDKFGGIIPRQPEHSLDITQATKAHNVRLRRNRIEAWREPRVLFTAEGNARSFFLHGCCPLYFSKIANVVSVAPDWDRLFVSDSTGTQVITLNNCKPTFYNLGVPAPVGALTASGTEVCSRGSDARAYVYTYVNIWGEESAPSPVSNTITIEDGVPVTLTGFAQVPNNYNIAEINIYRAVTGFRAPNVQQQEYNTTYLYITSVPVYTTEYIDRIPVAEVGPVLETAQVNTPPAHLRNIIALEDTIRLAGSVGNKVYFSEPFQTYNWPIKYELTLDDYIVHMGVGYGKIFVTTNSAPYIISPNNISNESGEQVQRASTNLPDIGGSYAHSAITTSYGFIYPSTLGLVLLRPDLSYTLLTAKWLSPEDWLELLPHTIRLGVYQNYLFIITDVASFILNIDRVSFGDMEGCELTTISDRPIDLLTSNTGDLLFLENGKVLSWDQGDQYRPYYWESRELVGQDGSKSTIALGPTRQNDTRGVSWSPASCKVSTEGTKLTIVSPLQNPAYTRFVSSEDWFRLPRIGRNLWYKMIFEGRRAVNFAAMGTSNFTLNQGK